MDRMIIYDIVSAISGEGVTVRSKIVKAARKHIFVYARREPRLTLYASIYWQLNTELGVQMWLLRTYAAGVGECLSIVRPSCSWYHSVLVFASLCHQARSKTDPILIASSGYVTLECTVAERN